MAFLFFCASTPAPAQASKQLPAVTINLPSDVLSEKVNIEYVLYGRFGSYGENVAPPKNVTRYRIFAQVKSILAESIKMVLWAPGCRIQTFEDELTGSVNLDRYFLCEHLPAVAVRGNVQPLDLLKKEPTEIAIYFVADWECRFFGWMDCMVPMLDLGTVKPDDTGRFELALPDFSEDPIASSKNAGEWQFVLREVKTWDHIADLGPADLDLRSASSGLRVLSSYPPEIQFVADPTR